MTEVYADLRCANTDQKLQLTYAEFQRITARDGWAFWPCNLCGISSTLPVYHIEVGDSDDDFHVPPSFDAVKEFVMSLRGAVPDDNLAVAE